MKPCCMTPEVARMNSRATDRYIADTCIRIGANGAQVVGGWGMCSSKTFFCRSETA